MIALDIFQTRVTHIYIYIDIDVKYIVHYLTPSQEKEGSGVKNKMEVEQRRGIDWLLKLYFSTVKILAQRLTHKSAVATVLLITKTFIVKY